MKEKNIPKELLSYDFSLAHSILNKFVHLKNLKNNKEKSNIDKSKCMSEDIF